MQVVLKGKPAPTIEWTRNGQPLKETDQIHFLKDEDVWDILK